MSENLLRHETSPYLIQHRENPVHWMPWGEAAFERARTENKPILLSIGYAACHWCHVMAHESFEDATTAALLNDLMVNIKVDREERPDVDTIYQAALAMLGEHGGWPLTMFLTPDREPFWGGTYFPPTARYGRPGFADVVRAVAESYRAEPDRVQQNVAALRDGLAQLSRPLGGDGITTASTDQVAERLAAEVDTFRGGIKGAPKFPQPGIFEQLWRAWRRTGNETFKSAVLTTLDNICQGGIYDHLGGGFARYSVDEMWLAPHFEKMLYDNAELIALLTLVWQETKSPLYAERVAQTVEWLTREMITPEGGFASSLDADSEGEEGKFYVWDEAEIEQILGPDSSTFKQVYGVSADGNWEGRNILNRLRSVEFLDADTETALRTDRARLLEIRALRIRPGKDDKVLADWNGLMIAGLAFAGQTFGRHEWTAVARRAYTFVKSEMAAEENRLHHSWRDGQARHPATLDDYANMSRAALALHEATQEIAFLADAETWAAVIEEEFGDPDGAYFFTAKDTPFLIQRTKTANDSAIPSGNGTLVGVLARLHHLTGKDEYRARADEIVRTFSGEIARNFFPLATLINNNELLEAPLQIVLIGEADAADTQALLGVIHQTSLPNRLLTVLPGPEPLPAAHPAAGKTMIDGGATVYICRGPVCGPPVDTAADLADALENTWDKN